MKIFLNNKLLDTDDGVIGVVLSPEDKKNILAMPPTNKYYVCFDPKFNSQEQVEEIILFHKDREDDEDNSSSG